jgi:hypothetical protein
MPCENCHTSTSWKPIRAIPEFNHDHTGYPLRGMHQKLSCTACHTSLVFSNVSKQCADCHADLHRGKMGSNCEQCHSVRGWQVSLDAIRNHQNRFPLIGAHALADCEECHTGAATGQFKGLSTACISCHQKDFQTPLFPHAALQFATTCQTCHTMDSWIGATFDHLKNTGFALTGAHATLPCVACHVNNQFQGTPATCNGCHAADYNGTTNPSHIAAGLPRDCSLCHTTVDWSNATFNHTLYTSYPLVGQHATVPCAQCHVNNVYAGTPTACFACHAKDFNGTTNPNHVTSGFPADCSLCHTPVAWSPSTFDHSTVFPLLGAHATTQCSLCHVNNNYATVPTDCYSCHVKDYNGTTNPNHVTAGFSTACGTCHSTVDWTGATFNHNNTPFPLTGAHTTVACTQCHVNNVFAGTPTDCFACHQTDFNGTTNPNHVTAGYPTTCVTCHNTSAWMPSTFNHNNTAFPLTGAHLTTQCSLCHVNNNYMTLPTDCYSCHTTDFTGTTSPPHVQAALPHTCSTCHTTVDWLNATFDHTLYAGYALTGMHATVACAQCHVNNVYVGTPTACIACHQTDFNGTTNPNHVTQGFPTDCTICHSTSGWTPSSFDHSTTAFPLTGAHATTQCSLCHVNGNFTTVPTDCYSCHTTDYNGTNNPAHAAAGFPTTCATCHTTTSWAGAVFDHSKTPFPLTGAHTTVACNLCHVNNVFAGTPTDCYSCHKADYTGTTNPNHTTAGFPTTCATCHTTTSWLGATFNHTYFNMNHGNAKGVCATCHTNSSDYSVFTCTGCHGKSETDGDHRSVTGYVYNSVNCYACHKNP